MAVVSYPPYPPFPPYPPSGCGCSCGGCGCPGKCPKCGEELETELPSDSRFLTNSPSTNPTTPPLSPRMGTRSTTANSLSSQRSESSTLAAATPHPSALRRTPGLGFGTPGGVQRGIPFGLPGSKKNKQGGGYKSRRRTRSKTSKKRKTRYHKNRN